jgi:hypothetical protein
MKKHNAESFIDLLYLPMTDTKIINTLDSLELEQPVVDEKYYEDLDISVDNDSIFFVFEESDENTSGTPCLSEITLDDSSDVTPPFNIIFDDSYLDVRNKLNGDANFMNQILNQVKIWTKKREDNKAYALTVTFSDKQLSRINTISITVRTEDNSDLGAIVENEV